MLKYDSRQQIGRGEVCAQRLPVRGKQAEIFQGQQAISRSVCRSVSSWVHVVSNLHLAVSAPAQLLLALLWPTLQSIEGHLCSSRGMPLPPFLTPLQLGAAPATCGIAPRAFKMAFCMSPSLFLQAKRLGRNKRSETVWLYWRSTWSCLLVIPMFSFLFRTLTCYFKLY